MGASRQLKASVSWMMAAISAPMPDCGNPSSTVMSLLVLMTLLTMVSRSRGLMVLRLITSQEMPSLAKISAACSEYLTLREQPTMVACLPSLMIFALPIGITQSGDSASSLMSKLSPQRFSFSRKTTTSPERMAAFSRPLLSSASQGEMVISPGMLEYHEAKHCECWAATAAAGPFSPRNTIPPLSYPALMQCSFAALLMMWSMACSEKFIVMNSMTGVSPIRAAPQPIPVNPASVMGVSHRRCGPHLSMSPFVILQAPWQLATSSPMMNTLSFLASSSSRALLRAQRTVILCEKLRVRMLVMPFIIYQQYPDNSKKWRNHGNNTIAPATVLSYYFQLTAVINGQVGLKISSGAVMAMLLIIIDIGWIIWGITFISRPRRSIPKTKNLKSSSTSALRILWTTEKCPSSTTRPSKRSTRSSSPRLTSPKRSTSLRKGRARASCQRPEWSSTRNSLTGTGKCCGAARTTRWS